MQSIIHHSFMHHQQYGIINQHNSICHLLHLFLKMLLMKIRMICNQRFILIDKNFYIRVGYINIEQPITFKQSFNASLLRY